MIGIKVRIKAVFEDSEHSGIENKIFECISEPYVAQNQHCYNQTFIIVKDLETNEIKEARVSQLAKIVTNQEFLKWKTK